MREKKVIGLLEEKGLEGFLFSSQANVLYLSGFRSSNAYVLGTKEGFYLFTDARYYERAKGTLREGWQAVLVQSPMHRAIKQNIKKLGIKRVGYEEDRVSCAFRKSLRSRDVQWVGFID